MGVLGDLLKLKKVQQLAAREVTRWWILSLLTKRFSSLSSSIVNGVYSIDDNTALEEFLLGIIDFQNLEEVITKLNPFLKSYPNLRSEKPVIMITQDRYQYQLYHLDEQQYSRLNEQSFCIKEDTHQIWDIENYLERQGKDLNLAQLNITLSEITGGSCQLYDDWKGSFCFPFALSISDQEKVLNNYLIILSDWRGRLEFRLKRLIADEEREQYSGIERHVIREPFKDEFSRIEINQFIRCLVTYLVGYFQVIKDKSHPVFFKHIDSNSILYGYNAKDYWEKHYEDSDEYHRELEQLKQSFKVKLNQDEEELKIPFLSKIEEMALEEGAKSGTKSTSQEYIIDLLEKRFGELPTNLIEDIKKIEESSVLRKLHLQIISVNSLPEFETLIHHAITDENPE